MSVERQIASMPDHFSQALPECAFRGCTRRAMLKGYYCHQHRAQVAEKIRELQEAGKVMPPRPVIVDREEPKEATEMKRDYLAPTGYRTPEPDPCDAPWDAVGIAETVCLLCAAMFSLAVWGAAWLRDTRLAAFAALCSICCVFAPIFLRWVQRFCHQVAEAFAWGLGE